MDEEKFRRSPLGYSPAGVRAFLRGQKTRTEALLMEKQERLILLRDENLRLKELIEEYQRRESGIDGALEQARCQARQMIVEARARTEAERAAARESLRRLEEQISERREALLLAARNLERLAAEFSRGAAQQARILDMRPPTEEEAKKA